MSQREQPVVGAIAHAIAWYVQTGWPTRDRDLAIARQIAQSSDDRETLLEAIVDALRASGAEPIPRAVLCRMAIQAVKNSSPSSRDR